MARSPKPLTSKPLRRAPKRAKLAPKCQTLYGIAGYKALIVTDEEYEKAEAYDYGPVSWSTKLIAVFLVPTSFKRYPDMREHGNEDEAWLASLRARFIEIPHDRESF